MSERLTLALTADLHWGLRTSGDAATRQLVDFLKEHQPDLLIVAGDLGAGGDFEKCLKEFDGLDCRKALVPGNHDIWVEADDVRGDSLQVYREHLPRLSAEHAFHYLDQEPLVFPEAGLAVVGSINWYDYSWSVEKLRHCCPEWEERLRWKRFTRGRHNDFNFVRWPLNDVSFTQEVVNKIQQHIQHSLKAVSQAIVVTHHPPFYGLNFPRPARSQTEFGNEQDIDAMLWDAFSGNTILEAVLAQHAQQVPFAFCGHTHRARENTFHSIHGINIGGDYHFKRLLLLDWPAGKVEEHVFGNPDSR